ncbi:MAG: hypothetical protein LBD13_07630 [Spirochaetaceae bacterium]|jgi:hypothetical protein|nr:hypothetical protein [Spirochaetaceae bacterium]
MASYIIFWPKDKIETYVKNGDTGPLQVIFGGPHRSQPPLGKVAAGDTVFPVTVAKGKMYLLGRMEIEKILDAETYIREVVAKNQPAITARAGQNNRGIDSIMWDTYRYTHKETVTHTIPWTCADQAALGRNGTSIQKRDVPESVLDAVRLGPRETPLKTQGGIIAAHSLQGHFRLLNKEAERLFNELFALEKGI